MRIKLSFYGVILITSLVLLSSCSKMFRGKEKSKTTGWNYNDPENGGYEYNDNYSQQTGPGLVLIQGGTFTMGRTQQDVMYDWNNVPRRVTVATFYIDKTEVRNVDYRMYLDWTKRVYVSYPEVYQKALPDTLVWRKKMAYNEPYVNNYLRHPAYTEYPVVGVSWEQAVAYCEWRTDRVNEQILVDKGILNHDPTQKDANNFNTEAYLAGQYEGSVRKNIKDLNPNNEERRVRWTDGILLPKYRLPTEAEWEYAAYALVGNTTKERVLNRRIYPWDGHVLRNSKRKLRGRMMANFARGRGDYMGTAGNLNDSGDITVPVDSYWPNDYGLFCMAGNVNEWVADVYRPLTTEDVAEFNPFRGNVFKTAIRDKNGKKVEKDSLGHIKYRYQTDEELKGRTNYKTADNRNHKDGDVQSSVVSDYEWNNPTHKKKGTSRMYVQENGEGGKGYSSLITDRSRVYKGGSWRDRAYWLNPSTRRFLDQGKSTDDIGFRCAMTYVGNPKDVIIKRKRNRR